MENQITQILQRVGRSQIGRNYLGPSQNVSKFHHGGTEQRVVAMSNLSERNRKDLLTV